MERKTYKPKEGLKVRLEDGTGFIAEEGQDLPVTAYILRRVADGDLIEVKAVKEKTAGKGDA